MWQWSKALLPWITKCSQSMRLSFSLKELFSVPVQSRNTLSHSCHISQWNDCGNEKSAVMSPVRSWHFPTFRNKAINPPTLTNLSYCRFGKKLNVGPFLSGLSFSAVLWTPWCTPTGVDECDAAHKIHHRGRQDAAGISPRICFILHHLASESRGSR